MPPVGSIRADSLELDSCAILLGLLTETECRAAHLLTQYGVAIQDVCNIWGISRKCGLPSEHEGNVPYHFDRDMNRAIRKAYLFALEFERSPILATEHLLLAILYGNNDTTQWLIERGANRQALEADIRERNGYVNSPLDFEEDSEEASGEWGEASGESLMSEGGRRKTEEETKKMAGTRQNGESEVLGTQYSVPGTTMQNSEHQECDIRLSSFEFRDFAPPSSFPTLPSSPLLRILDAAANRAREGLRVVEDFLRFVCDDRFLTETAKNLRHDLVAQIKSIPAADLLASRETQADVGAGLTTAAETVRADLADVLAANFGRLEESLRSLEEYGKLLDTAMAAQFKQIRYRIYTLERAVEITRQSCERLANAKLYVLIDGRESLDDFRRFASSLITAGVHVLQLRDKKLDDRQLLDRARVLRELTCSSPTLFIMNDRPDLALLSQADGAHLGQEELTVKDARAILGPQALIGVSAHSIEQARQAVLDGANYIGVGPTFPSTTKDFAAFPGLESALRQVAAEIRLPAFAIGGITPENLPEILATGIGRVAVSGVITNAENPAGAAKEMLSEWQPK